MPKSPEVDIAIAKSSEFSQPYLKKLRVLFHKACPKIEESLKWGCPHFEYKGLVGGIAGFKAHAHLGFSKGALLSDPKKLLKLGENSSIGSIKIASNADMPPDSVLIAYIREAVELNENGIKPEKKKNAPRPIPKMPRELLAALKKNKKAAAAFEKFSPSCKREYIEWIAEAKREETRAKRIDTAIEWIDAGKSRNWKYQK